MKQVRISFHPIATKVSITVDDRTLDTYCDLASYLGEEFLRWADRLFILLDEEINHPYALEVVGLEFHRLLISEMAEKSEMCSHFCFKEVSSRFDIDQHISELERVKRQYPAAKYPPVLQEKIACTSNVPQQAGTIFHYLDMESNESSVIRISIGEDTCIPDSTALRIVLSDHIACRFNRQRVTVFVTSEAINAFEEYVVRYLHKVPYVQKLKEAFSYLALSQMDQLLLRSLEEDRGLYMVEHLPSEISCGEVLELRVHAVPSFVGTGDIELKVSDASVLCLDGDSICGLHAGISQVEVFAPSGESIASFQLRVVQHNYVENIVITPMFDILRPNTSGQLHFFMSPENAEDAEEFDVSSSNTNVALVKRNGQVIAVGNGSSTITIKTREASASYTVHVQPIVDSIAVSPSDKLIMEDESVDLHLHVQPSDANAEKIKWTVDNEVLATITPSSNRMSCTVRAGRRVRYITNVTVQCSVDGCTASSCVQIKPYDRKEGLSITTIIATVIAGLLCWLPIIFNVPLWVATVCSIIGNINNRAGVKSFRYCLILNLIFGFISLLLYGG